MRNKLTDCTGDNILYAIEFRTADNRLGAWRVAGTEGDPANPSGVKIGYKLLQTGKTPSGAGTRIATPSGATFTRAVGQGEGGVDEWKGHFSAAGICWPIIPSGK